jgi:dGTP triphosphohydrolase
VNGVVEPKDITTKKQPVTVEASAAKIKTFLGEAGVPIADGLMTLKSTLDAGINEMRGYANGADKSAQEAKASAGKALAAIEAQEGKNDAFLDKLDQKTSEMVGKVTLSEVAATRAEAALEDVRTETSEVNLAIKELKATTSDGKPVTGVAALQAMSDNYKSIPSTVESAVETAVSTKTQYVSQTAGEALETAKKAESAVEELKGKLDALASAVEDAFDSVDTKIKAMVKLLQLAVLDLVNETSYDNTSGDAK